MLRNGIFPPPRGVLLYQAFEHSKSMAKTMPRELDLVCFELKSLLSGHVPSATVLAFENLMFEGGQALLHFDTKD